MRLLEKPNLENPRKRAKVNAPRSEKWSVVNEFTTHKVSDALEKCKNENTLYNFAGIFPGIDLAAQIFQELFQITVSCSHTIHLDTILAICDFVRENNPNDTVKLYFVVPSSVYNSYQCWQSFKTKENTIEVQKNFNDLPEDIQVRLGNLEQYVIHYLFLVVGGLTCKFQIEYVFV